MPRECCGALQSTACLPRSDMARRAWAAARAPGLRSDRHNPNFGPVIMCIHSDHQPP